MSSPFEAAQTIVNKAITELRDDLPASLVGYLSEVLEWNAVLSLVSRKDPTAACERLLLESLELGRHLQVEQVGRLADIGSGAGFPGLVLALMHPGVEVVLIERREKRALFLDRTSRKLHARNVTVLSTDAGAVSRETSAGGSFDLVTSVAVGNPTDMAGDAEGLLVTGGRFASTIPRELEVEAQLGESLHLVDRFVGKFGCYVTYRRGV